MRLSVTRKPNHFNPDFRRVIIRFINHNPKQTRSIIERIITMPDKDIEDALTYTLREFTKRHRNLTRTFSRNFEKAKASVIELCVYLEDKEESDSVIKEILRKLGELDLHRKLLIGAYFSQEYSIESAAFFNPAIVESPDQTGLEKGSKRVIVSFRATGEGHISSIVFRSGIINKNGDMDFEIAGRYVEEAELIRRNEYHKKDFKRKLKEMKLNRDVISAVMDRLNDVFIYGELRLAVEQILQENNDASKNKRRTIEQIVWLADSHYELIFSEDTHITERVIFPVSYTERNGIEDARFVRFIDDDGKVLYYATYTAYSGQAILPKLIETEDFYHFRIKPLHGRGAHNKNLALFPRKINGKYVMFSRIDEANGYVMFSDNINIWEEPILLHEPKYFWEFIKVGNCGSPVETEDGWLVITHGVGPMRQYSIGAMLLDLNDPTKVIGRLSVPLLVPNDEEREGYVPNVVYSCGNIIHNDELIVPYGMSDTASGFMSVNLKELLKEIKNNK